MDIEESDVPKRAETSVIAESEIPDWLKSEVQRMIDFALKSGGEKPEGIGVEIGFYHAHLVIPRDLKLSRDKLKDWSYILNNLHSLLGHTQELRTYDVSKRSIFLPINGDPEFVHPISEYERFQEYLSRHKDGLKIEFKVSEEAQELFKAIQEPSQHQNAIESSDLFRDREKQVAAGTAMIDDLKEGKNLRMVGVVYFLKQPGGELKWKATMS